MEKEQGFCEGKRLQDSKTRGRKIRKKDTTSFACSLFARPLPPVFFIGVRGGPALSPGFSGAGGRREAPFPAFSSSFLSLLLSPAEGLSLELAAEGGGQGSGREVSVSDEVKSSCPRSPRLLPAERGLAKSNPLLPASPRGRVIPLSDRGHWARSLDEVKRAKKGKRSFLPFFSFSFFFKRSKRKGKNGRGGRPRLRRVRCRGAT